ncbi:hypothetical protein PFISCL1PPCAC_21259, partial [Pristionchus fissidentatus]
IESSSLSVARQNKEEEEKKQNYLVFPIIDLPDEISAKILLYMGKRELNVCMQSFSLHKAYVNWRKYKKIDRMFIKMIGNEITEFKCNRYRFYSSNFYSFNSSLRNISDKFREIYGKCEIDTATLSLCNVIPATMEYCVDLVRMCAIPSIKNLDIDYENVGYNVINDTHDIINDEMLRELLISKKVISINLITCTKLTAQGVFEVYKDWISGQLPFENFNFSLPRPTVIRFVELFREAGYDITVKPSNRGYIIGYQQFDPMRLAKLVKLIQRNGMDNFYIFEWTALDDQKMRITMANIMTTSTGDTLPKL